MPGKSCAVQVGTTNTGSRMEARYQRSCAGQMLTGKCSIKSNPAEHHSDDLKNVPFDSPRLVGLAGGQLMTRTWSRPSPTPPPSTVRTGTPPDLPTPTPSVQLTWTTRCPHSRTSQPRPHPTPRSNRSSYWMQGNSAQTTHFCRSLARFYFVSRSGCGKMGHP